MQVIRDAVNNAFQGDNTGIEDIAAQQDIADEGKIRSAQALQAATSLLQKVPPTSIDAMARAHALQDYHQQALGLIAQHPAFIQAQKDIDSQVAIRQAEAARLANQSAYYNGGVTPQARPGGIGAGPRIVEYGASMPYSQEGIAAYQKTAGDALAAKKSQMLDQQVGAAGNLMNAGFKSNMADTYATKQQSDKTSNAAIAHTQNYDKLQQDEFAFKKDTADRAAYAAHDASLAAQQDKLVAAIAALKGTDPEAANQFHEQGMALAEQRKVSYIQHVLAAGQLQAVAKAHPDFVKNNMPIIQQVLTQATAPNGAQAAKAPSQTQATAPATAQPQSPSAAIPTRSAPAQTGTRNTSQPQTQTKQPVQAQQSVTQAAPQAGIVDQLHGVFAGMSKPKEGAKQPAVTVDPAMDALVAAHPEALTEKGYRMGADPRGYSLSAKQKKEAYGTTDDHEILAIIAMRKAKEQAAAALMAQHQHAVQLAESQQRMAAAKQHMAQLGVGSLYGAPQLPQGFSMFGKPIQQ